MNNYTLPIYNPNNQYIISPQMPFQAPLYSNLPAQNFSQFMPASYPQNYYLNQIANNDGAVIPFEIKREDEFGRWRLTGVEKTPYNDNIYKYQLKNGQTVVLMPKKDSTTIIKTFVHAGSMNENDRNRGISHFNEHNVFNGSSKIAPGAFFKEVGKMGASTNASTDFAQTDFYIESPIIDNKSFQKIIEMHSDMLVNPLFPADMVEKEKGPVTSEISMCNDNMGNTAINELIKNLFQINTTSNDLVAGSIETVNNITRDDVYNHWKNYFTPDNMYTVLTGDFDPNVAIDLISNNFTTPSVQNPDSKRTYETLTPINQSIRKDFISPNDASTSVYCGFAGPTPKNTKDSIALNMLGYLLLGDNSSRLSKEFNKMYAQGIYTTQKVGLKEKDPIAIIYQFATQGGDDSKALDKFYDSVKSIYTNPPTEEEMLIIKNSMLKNLSASFEDSETITNTIGSALLDGCFDGISEYKKIIENMTPYDLVQVADKYLDFGKMSISVVHPYNMTPDNIQKNYNNSIYSKANSNISFTGRHISTDNIEQLILNDNAALAIADSSSDNCYFTWRLTSKDNIPKNPACSYVLAQILNDGSKFQSREDFNKNAGTKSVSMDIDVNSFQVKIDGDCLYTNMNDAINCMKEALYAPRFTKEDFDAAVKKIETYCNSMNKDASINLLAELYGKYFPSPKQIMEGLKTLTLEDVKNQYNNLIFNSSSNITVSAPINNHPELKNEIINNMYTDGVKFKPHAPMLLKSFEPNKKPTVLLDTEERNQAQIYKNYSFEISGNIEDEIKLELLNTILGGSPNSRLFQDLREKEKLAYTTSSQIQSFENSGILTLNILTTTDDKKQNDIKYENLQKSLDGFQKHTDLLMSEYVSDEELEAAKMKLKQTIASQMELPATKCALVSMNMTQPYGIKRIDEYVNAIDKITKQDIKDAACHVFSNKPVYSILASPDTVSNNMDYINNLGEVVKL